MSFLAPGLGPETCRILPSCVTETLNINVGKPDFPTYQERAVSGQRSQGMWTPSTEPTHLHTRGACTIGQRQGTRTHDRSTPRHTHARSVNAQEHARSVPAKEHARSHRQGTRTIVPHQGTRPVNAKEHDRSTPRNTHDRATPRNTHDQYPQACL